MTLIGTAAYFELCQNPGCTVPHQHGTIVCTDGLLVNCHSKQPARQCIDDLLEQKFITDVEKLALLDQIDNSGLEECNAYPIVFYRSEEGGSKPFKPTDGVGVLSGIVDDELAEELDEGLTEPEDGDDGRPTVH